MPLIPHAGFFVRILFAICRRVAHVRQIAPLLFDTIVTAMTVWKAFHIRVRNSGPSSKLIQTFLREGIPLLRIQNSGLRVV